MASWDPVVDPSPKRAVSTAAATAQFLFWTPYKPPLPAPKGWEPRLPERIPTPLKPLTIETNFLGLQRFIAAPKGWEPRLPDKLSSSIRIVTAESVFWNPSAPSLVPAGWQALFSDRIPTQLKPVTADGQFLALQGVVAATAGWPAVYPDKIPSFKPIIVDTCFLGLAPFALDVGGIPSGDGPPWGLTGEERRQLEAYYSELAELREEWDENHRADAQQLLNDVRRAAGLPVEEPAEVDEPVTPAQIRERIAALPSMPGLLSVNLDALKAKAAEDARLALEEDDEEDLNILLLH